VRNRTLVGAGAAAVAVVVVVGALVADGGDDAPRSVLVDERGGSLHGVRFGDGEPAVRERLGPPSDDAQGVFPEGRDYTGPPAIPSPRSDQRPPRMPTPLHYGDTAYLVSPTVGVFSMSTLESGARTRAGVGIGDDLDRVRARYDGAHCSESVAGEPVFGGETPMYPWCRVIVAGTRVFFGEDPIQSITLTRYAR
jgi:hypothetical protein